MKLVERAIYELLKSLASGKVFAMRAPEGEVGPFIIFQRPDGERWRSLNGPSGLAQVNIQIDAYASTYFGAKELAASVENILDGYRGKVYYDDNSPQDFVDIKGSSLQNEVDFFDQTDDPPLFRTTVSFLIIFEQ